MARKLQYEVKRRYEITPDFYHTDTTIEKTNSKNRKNKFNVFYLKMTISLLSTN